MMATEFHGLDLTCSPNSIIPDGPGYVDVTYQSCAIAGSIPGSLTVSGDMYVAENFGFSYNHVWRNFGILLLFTVAFILLAAFFSELFEWSEGGGGAVEYKETSEIKVRRARNGKDEEEKPVEVDTHSPPPTSDQFQMKYSDTRVNLASSTSTFTWKDLTYTIPYDGSTKMLLNNISGYCAPGQMTALVGSSGAGKTTRKLYFCY
jgi:ATP-binding cassette, subfamily G (WHITE), member 2, SNQ2